MDQQPQFPQGNMFGGNSGGGLGGGLPPKRAPGQSPLTASLPSGPGPQAWGAGAPPAGGLSSGGMPNGGALPNHSRLIPGAPVLPGGPAGGSALGQGGMPGSLLGRDVSSAPMSPMTQPLQPGTLSGSLGGGGSGVSGFGSGAHSPSASAPHTQAPLPSGRKMADLREPRGASFLRLAFAALFLLGFLGVVGFFLKDYLPPSVLSLLQRGDAEESPASPEPGTPTAAPAMPTPPVLPRHAAETPPPSSEPKESAPPPAPMGFDPLESTAGKTAAADPAPPAETIATPVMPTGVPETGKSLEVASVGSSSTSSTLTKPPDPAAVLSGEDGDGAIPEKAKPAAEALRKFLAATTLEERLRHTLGAELMQPLMERYYARSQEGAVIVDRIQFLRLEPNPELGSGSHCIFSLENKTWEFPVPVMLEEQTDGYKVDWLSFVEFKDRLLEKFFKGYQEGSIRAHVGIMRHHYFEDGVPNADRKDAFRITPAPPNTFQASAFIDKDSAFGQEMRKRLPWDKHTWAIVDLEWKKLGTQQWVEVTAMPQTHWYSLPPRPVTTPQQPSVQPGASSKEMPAGISKNGVGSGGAAKANTAPKGISKSTPGLPGTIKRPLPAGR